MADQETREIFYEDGSSEGLLVSVVGSDLYRLEESSMLGEALFGDVIETETRSGGRLQFVRVATFSGLHTVSCLLTPQQIQASGLPPLLDRVKSLGGTWERALGGLLIIHLPKSVNLNIEKEIAAL